MTYTRVIKSSLLALVPVIATLALWILFRADKLVRLFEPFEPAFFIPRTPAEAIRSGYIFWFAVAFVLSFVCGYIYYWVTQKWHWQAMYYAITLTAGAALIGLLAYFFDVQIAVEAAGELLIVAIGFGVFIPWFAQKNLRQYS